MYKIKGTLLSFLLSLHILYAQTPEQQKAYAPFGGPLTPAGDIRILVVFAGFEEDCNKENEQYNFHFWPQEIPGTTPCQTFFKGYEELFYTDTNQFHPEARDRSLSNFFYQASRNNPNRTPFRVVADYFPERINISGNMPNNRLLFDKMQELYPNYDWSRYDQRTNNPRFMFDNSTSEPDNIIDYIITIWRKPGLSGYASTNTYTFTTSIHGHKEEYKINSFSGFTINASMFHLEGVKGLFLHEFAHSLFNCPHLFAANGVHGNYFYASNGWGMMKYGDIVSTPNAWESWYNVWIELPPDRDLKDKSQNGTYTLQDFASTGDAMRIKIPFTSQYLWLENHKGTSTFDSREKYTEDGLGNPIPPVNPGLFMYVENLTDDRNHIISALSPQYANGIKVMHANGNYDYLSLGHSREAEIWNNHVVNFKQLFPNPAGAHNDMAMIRDNFGFDGQDTEEIVYRNFTNNRCESCGNSCNNCPDTRSNEFATVYKKDSIYTYDGLGVHMAWGNKSYPQKTGLSHNPMIVQNRRYNAKENRLEPVILHGLSVTVHPKERNGDIKIEVTFEDFEIQEHQRFTGNLLLKKNENSSYDMVIKEGVNLTLDKSGTPDRHTRGEYIAGDFKFPDFVNPTILTLDSNARILVENKGKLTLKKGSTLHLKPRAAITTTGNGKIIIEKGAYLLLEEGANLFTETAKNLRIHAKSIKGINPLLLTNDNYNGSQ